MDMPYLLFFGYSSVLSADFSQSASTAPPITPRIPMTIMIFATMLTGFDEAKVSNIASDDEAKESSIPDAPYPISSCICARTSGGTSPSTTISGVEYPNPPKESIIELDTFENPDTIALLTTFAMIPSSAIPPLVTATYTPESQPYFLMNRPIHCIFSAFV